MKIKEKGRKKEKRGSISSMYIWYYIFYQHTQYFIYRLSLIFFQVILTVNFSPFSLHLLLTLPSAWVEGGWRKSITEYSTAPYTGSFSRRQIGFRLFVLSSDMPGPKPLWSAESGNTRIKSDMHLLYHSWATLVHVIPVEELWYILQLL